MSKKRQRWSKELIIERIRERHREGLSLSVRDVQRDVSPLYQAALCHFGSWQAAIEAAGFSYDGVRKAPAPFWSKELIVERIRERYAGGLPLNSGNIMHDDSPLYRAARLHFGTWETAVKAAGLPYDDVRKAAEPYWSKELIIERIRRRYDERLSLSSADVQREDHALFLAAVHRRYFSSWEAAIEAAGFAYLNVRKCEVWSKELTIEYLHDRYRGGFSLTSGDVRDDDPSLYGAACRHFGSWEAAIEAAGFSYPRVCKVRRTKDLSRSSESEDRGTFLQNLGSRKKSRERKSREEKRG